MSSLGEEESWYPLAQLQSELKGIVRIPVSGLQKGINTGWEMVKRSWKGPMWMSSDIVRRWRTIPLNRMHKMISKYFYYLLSPLNGNHQIYSYDTRYSFKRYLLSDEIKFCRDNFMYKSPKNKTNKKNLFFFLIWNSSESIIISSSICKVFW